MALNFFKCCINMLFFVGFAFIIVCAASEPEDNFLGCYTLTDCSFSEYREGKHVISDKRPGEGGGQECIDYCNSEVKDKGMYGFAGLLSFKVYHKCYCFENGQLSGHMGHKERDIAACVNCSDDCGSYFMVWQTCPVGFYDPQGGCDAKCPDYCKPKPGTTQVRCTKTDCVDGCVDGFCGNVVPIEQIGTTPTQLADHHPAMFVMYTEKHITKSGYVSAISYYGRTKGLAYVSIWKYHGVDDKQFSIYTMIGKVAIENDFEGLQELQLEPHEFIHVEPGNVIAVHFDHNLLEKIEEGQQDNFTIFYSSGEGPVAKFSEARVLKDNGWAKDRLILINPKNEINIEVSMALTISGICPEGCKDRACTSNGGEITCTLGCVAGYKGNNCSQTCSPQKYGANCALDCNSQCLLKVSPHFEVLLILIIFKKSVYEELFTKKVECLQKAYDLLSEQHDLI